MFISLYNIFKMINEYIEILISDVFFIYIKEYSINWNKYIFIKICNNILLFFSYGTNTYWFLFLFIYI